MKDYTRGDAIWCKFTFRDEDDLLVDPSSVWGAVYDSSSTIVTTFAGITRTSTGHYKYAWQSSRGNAAGVTAVEACGLAGAMVYVRREILFKLV